MIKNLKFKIKNPVRGITLIEILLVVFIIALFSSILVADFPKIRRQFALTRTVYKMSQDLRRAQDMALSGQQIKDANGDKINVQGYGIYINLDNTSLGKKKYIIYADMTNDQQYDVSGAICGQQLPNRDCVIETIDLSQTEAGVIISRITNPTDVHWIDINFKPPNPTIKITNLSFGNRAQIIFALESDPLKTERIVSVNTAGLIEIK